MTFRTVKEAVNYVLWARKGELQFFRLVVVDRLSSTGLAEIPFESIEGIDNNYVYLNDGTVIPNHRVVGIKKGESYIWKRGRSETEQ